MTGETFNRFDTCEAWSCLAHDWGLYAISTRLDRMGFKPSPTLSMDSMADNARMIFDRWNIYFTANPNAAQPYALHAPEISDLLEWEADNDRRRNI